MEQKTEKKRTIEKIVKDIKEIGIEKTPPSGKLLAVIRISGEVKVKPKVKNILNRLRLRRKYSCVLINPKNNSIAGMLKKVKFNVAFGDIDRESLVELIKKRGRKIDGKKFNSEEVAENLLKGKKLGEIGFKPFFRLHPPRGGIKSKLQYPKGVLGDNKEDINKLIRRML